MSEKNKDEILDVQKQINDDSSFLGVKWLTLANFGVKTT